MAGLPRRDRKDQPRPAQTLLGLADNSLRGHQMSHHYGVIKGLQTPSLFITITGDNAIRWRWWQIQI